VTSTPATLAPGRPAILATARAPAGTGSHNDAGSSGGVLTVRHAQHFVYADGQWKCSDNNCRALIDLNGSLTHVPKCTFGPERYGHDLVREIIAKHGRDRFPSVSSNLLQLGSEVGELMGAYVKALNDISVPVPKRWVAARGDLKVRKELADTGLSLYEVANKLGINLIEAMAEVVENETRRF
jgi:hypothetical protein